METLKPIFDILPKPEELRTLDVGSLFFFSPNHNTETGEVAPICLGYFYSADNSSHVHVFPFYPQEEREDGVMTFSPDPNLNGKLITLDGLHTKAIPLNDVVFDANLATLKLYDTHKRQDNEPSRLGNLVLCNIEKEETPQPGFVYEQLGEEQPDDVILRLSHDNPYHREQTYMVWQFTAWSGWIDGRKVFNIMSAAYAEFFDFNYDVGRDSGND